MDWKTFWYRSDNGGRENEVPQSIEQVSDGQVHLLNHEYKLYLLLKTIETEAIQFYYIANK